MKKETNTPESLFTGGEWRLSDEAAPDLTIWSYLPMEGGTILNECVATVWGSSNTEANALLISEAKNMLDIVKQVNFYFSNEANYPEGTIGYLMGQNAKAILSRINKQP